MELSWLMKLRIAAAFAVGALLIGILAWPLVSPVDPFGPVLATNISLGGKATLAIIAFACGLLAYFLAWPFGRQIAVTAVPFGLGIWAIRSGSIAAFLQQNPSLAHRQQLYAMLRTESIFWLLIIAAGFAGTLLAQKLSGISDPSIAEEKPKSNVNKYLNPASALVASAIIAQFALGILAQNFKISDAKLGNLVAQPSIGQIVFAVFVSFGLAAFLVKVFLDIDYIWPTIAAALLTVFTITSYASAESFELLQQRWPAVFFSNPIAAILPIQMVSFAALGSVAGYWMAIRYNYWRKHEIK